MVKFVTTKKIVYSPKILFSDFSKSKFCFSFYIEEKIEGKELLKIWPTLSPAAKTNIIEKLYINLKDLHSKKGIKTFGLTEFEEEYNKRLNEIFDSKILNSDKIKYLTDLKQCFNNLLNNQPTGIIHGDLHFDNVILKNDGSVCFIDFEKVKDTFLIREFDSINRMERNPNSFIVSNDVILSKQCFSGITQKLIELEFNVYDQHQQNVLLLFDCVNALYWLKRYPDYEPYRDVLFNKSKILTK